MSTIASLIIDIGANTAGLRKGLAQSDALLRQFQRSSAISANFSKSLGTGFLAAEASVQDFVQSAQNTFDRFTSRNREQFARGVISPEEFRKNGVQAMRAFDQTMLAGLEDFRSRFGGSGFTQALENQITQQFKGLGVTGADAFSQSLSQRLVSAGGSISKIGDSFATTGKRLSIGLTLPLAYAGYEFAKFGADAAAASQKLDLTFGPTAARIRDGIQEIRKILPGTTREVMNFVDLFGEMLLNFGYGRDQAADMALKLTSVAASLALFRNRSPQEALIAIRSAMNGLTRPIRDFGVFFREADVRAMAFHMGLSKSATQAINPAARAMATYQLILKNSTIQQALAAELAGNVAQKFKFMGSNIREARDIIGQQMLPVMGALAEQVSAVAVALGRIDPETIKVFLTLGAALIALGPSIWILGNVAKAIGFLTTAIGILIGPASLGGLLAFLTPEGIILAGLAAIGALAFNLYLQMNKATEATLNFRASLKGMGEEALNNRIDIERALLAGAQKNLADKTSKGHGIGETTKAILKGGDLTDLWKGERDAVDQYASNLEALTNALKAYRQTQHNLPHVTPPFTPGGDGAKPKTLLDVLDAQAKVLREQLKGDIAVGRGFETLKTAATEYRDSMLQLAGAEQFQALQQISSAKTFDERVAAYDRLSQAIGAASEAQDLLNDIVKAGQEAKIQQALAPLKGAIGQFQDIGAPGFGGLNVDIAAQQAVREQANKTREVLDSMFAGGIITGDQFREALKKIHDLMVAMGLITDKDAVKFERFAKQIRVLQSASRALAGLADIAGSFGDQDLQNMLNAASHLTESVAALLANPTDVGSWIGAFASGIAVLKTLFGKSQLAISINEALKTNNQKLTELNQTLQGFNPAAAGTQRQAGNALNSALASPGLLQGLNLLELFGTLQDQINVLQPFLNSVGLNFQQLAAVAKNLGINIFDKNGRIIGSALAQLAEAIDKNATIITRWNDHSLSDLKDQTAISNAIAGIADTAAQRWTDNIAILTKLAPRLGSQFAGVDVSTTAGQDLARSIMQKILTQIQMGLLTSADLGDLQNLGELLSLFSPLADSLNQMRDAVDGVNQVLENVPTGFKLALAVFDAMLPELPPQNKTALGIGGGIAGGPDNSNAGLNPLGGQSMTMNFYGDIVLPESDVTPREQVKGIIREAMNMSVERFGTPAKWSQLMVQ